jgi:hypothetical protein
VVVAGEVLAINVSAGTSGFLVVVLLCLAAVGLFALLSGSLRRLRNNVDSGEFGEAAKRRRGAADHDQVQAQDAPDDGAAGVPGPRSSAEPR